MRADIPVPCGRPSFLSFFLIIIRSAVLFNIRLPLRPCCCSPATSEGFFLFPLQFCRFFTLSAKFSVYSGRKQKTPEFPLWGTLVQHITSPCPVAAGCGVLWTSSHLSTHARKKCIFSRKKFVQPVRSVLVRICTANQSKLKRIIVCILDFCTPYRPYRLFEVRTQFFQMRTEQSSSHCANLIVILPQETFPLGESSKSPLHFAAHRDESVIVGYYTSVEVHLPTANKLFA